MNLAKCHNPLLHASSDTLTSTTLPSISRYSRVADVWYSW